MTRKPVLLDWIALIALALVWGASFIFIKRSVKVFEPAQMAMWRMVLAMLVYMPIAAAYWSKIDWKRWRPLVVVAFCGSAIPNYFFAIAQQHVNSSLAGVLNSLTPLFTLVLGVAFFQMKATWYKALGVSLGLVGAAVLILHNGSGVNGESSFWFAALCVLATVCYAVNANVVGRYLRDLPPAAIASAAFMITGWLFVIGLFATGGWGRIWEPGGMVGLGYVFYLAAIGTVAGSIGYFWLMQRTSPLFATSVTYLLPISAILIGIFDGEQVQVWDYLGTGIILTGLYLAQK